MDSSFENRLIHLANSAKAYIDQIKSDDPLTCSPTLLSTYTFHQPAEKPTAAQTSIQTPPLKASIPKAAHPTPIPPQKQPSQEPSKVTVEPKILTKPVQAPKDIPITLNKPSPALKTANEDILKTLKKIAPSVEILSSIPSDEKAKHIKNGWKEKHAIPVVPILASSADSIPFLTNVAQAISLHFFSSKVVLIKDLEQNQQLNSIVELTHIKLIIAPDMTLWNCKELMKHYQEIPQQKQRFLKNIPLLLLPDPKLYLKDPTLKRSLWNLLCHLLQPLKS